MKKARRYVYEFPVGAIDPEHDLFRCPTCNGEGGFEVQLPAGVTDLEPRYRDVICEDCDARGFSDESECTACGYVIEPDVDGVGMIEREVAVSFQVWAYCGACAWAEIVND